LPRGAPPSGRVATPGGNAPLRESAIHRLAAGLTSCRLERSHQRGRRASSGAPSRTRTDTETVLSRPPLPIGLWGLASLERRGAGGRLATPEYESVCQPRQHRHRDAVQDVLLADRELGKTGPLDRKSTRLNSSH